MRVYRVCKAVDSDLSGEGARLYGGRWNNPGLAIVYTASSLSLAILETRVHLRRLPIDYISLTIEIPDADYRPHEIEPAVLGAGWRKNEAATRRVGDAHFTATPLIPLKVPSVVVDTEWNILFSPDYATAFARIVEAAPIDMDPRLWNV